MKVLIVEDNPVDLKLMRAVLQESGCTIGESSSALEALDAIQSELPDVLLLDLHLPGMDGVALVRELRSTGHARTLPIIAVTAYPSRYRRDALDAGCDACIAKPIDTRQLAATLREVHEALDRR